MVYIATVTQPIVTLDGERVELVAGEMVEGLTAAAAGWLLAAGWIVDGDGAPELPETPESKMRRPTTRKGK